MRISFHLVDLCPTLEVLGIPCDRTGSPLPPDTPPPPLTTQDINDWTPYSSRVEFETAEFLFKKTQMSKGDVDTLLMLWATSLVESNQLPPFANADDLHDVIDATTLGDAPWHTFSVRYNGNAPNQETPPWMSADYQVWYRDPHVVLQNMFANPDFKEEIDYTCYREFSADGKRRYGNFMSGNLAWRHSVSFIVTFCDMTLVLLMICEPLGCCRHRRSNSRRVHVSPHHSGQ